MPKSPNKKQDGKPSGPKAKKQASLPKPKAGNSRTERGKNERGKTEREKLGATRFSDAKPKKSQTKERPKLQFGPAPSKPATPQAAPQAAPDAPPKPLKRKELRRLAALAEAQAAASTPDGVEAEAMARAESEASELVKSLSPARPDIAQVSGPEASPEKNSARKANGESREPRKITPRKTVSKANENEPGVESAAEEPIEPAADIPGFDSLGLSETLAQTVAALGFETPTPIQARAIPPLLAGHDLIGQAQTGTGKTAAFALPLIQKVDPARNETQALVLAPTRELAIQVAGGIYDLAKQTGLRVVPVYGGQPIDRQFRALRSGAHIVVGTPGRVIDHMRRGTLTFENISICVLDEADEMLALGFLEDMETILAELPEERQLAFFSATMPPRIAALTKRFLRDPKHISIEAKRRTVDAIAQTYYDVPRGKKLDALGLILDMETPGPTIVFCRTRQETNDLSEALRLRGYGAEALNGEMSQADRARVLRRFKDGQADLLVATDVAARGLDIETVTHVINYDIPWDVEQYIHRIGRTGRAGRTGDAITLVEGKEFRQLRFIERMIGVTLKRARIPTTADITTRQRELFKEALRETLVDGNFDEHFASVQELAEEFDESEIAAAALHLLWQNQSPSGRKRKQK